MEEVKKGDWIRFYRGEELVIGVVEYLTRHPVLRHTQVATNIGTIRPDDILEVRSKNDCE